MAHASDAVRPLVTDEPRDWDQINYESAWEDLKSQAFEGPGSLMGQRDAARREANALRTENEHVREALSKELSVHVQQENALRDENEALKAELNIVGSTRDELRAENEWLRRNIPAASVNMNNWQVRYREWREAGMPDENT